MIKKISLLLFFAAINLQSAEVCGQNSCNLPGAVQDKGAMFKVLSPVGTSSVKPINQAPRLKTLNNKTIAIVGAVLWHMLPMLN